MLTTLRIPLFILIFCIAITSLSAQQTVTISNKTFGACETIEASIGNTGERLSVFIAEHELRAGYGGKYERTRGMAAEADNLDDIPKGYTLLLDVDFTRKFKFPIEAKDSVFVTLSNMQLDQRSQQLMQQQMSAQKNKMSAASQEIKTMQQQSKSLEAKAKEIAKQMKAGKISQQEASQKLMALQNQIENMVDNSSVINQHIEEPEDEQNYAINIVDTKLATEANVYSGTLHIIRFNKNEFVAKLYNGQEIVGCLEKRSASSQSEEKKCKSLKSSLFPGLFVLEESNTTMNINVKLKKFEDFRY
ncbi:MAG: hypothetical protein AAF617_14525 [Bacteroidota bacterium]